MARAVQTVRPAVTHLFDPAEALGFHHASRPLELPEVGFQLAVGRQPNVLGPKLVDGRPQATLAKILDLCLAPSRAGVTLGPGADRRARGVTAAGGHAHLALATVRVLRTGRQAHGNEAGAGPRHRLPAQAPLAGRPALIEAGVRDAAASATGCGIGRMRRKVGDDRRGPHDQRSRTDALQHPSAADLLFRHLAPLPRD